MSLARVVVTLGLILPLVPLGCTSPNERVRGLESQNRGLADELRQLNAKYVAAVRDAQDARQALERQLQTLAAVQAQNEVLRGALKAAGKEAEAGDTIVKQLAEAQLNARKAEGQLATLEQHLKELAAERNAAQGRVRELEEELTRARTAPPPAEPRATPALPPRTDEPALTPPPGGPAVPPPSGSPPAQPTTQPDEGEEK